MSGFRHDELADVNLITDNLRDRYKDQFSILKELVQNADDAGARNLRFGLVPGDTGNAHPLLRGPGLLAVNDGPFTDRDFRAMCSFGLNSKAGDVATIGKYGLGMKSVFHLSEALFFIAESESQPYNELLTPWGGIRSDWDISEAQWSRDLPSLRRSWLEAVRWTIDARPFVLYIPLRRKAHLQMPDGRTAGAIIENYPGDDDGVLKLLCNETTSVRLSSLLPLLRDILSIQIYAPADNGSLELVHSSELDPDSTRPLRKHRDGQSELKAAITTRGRRALSVGWQRFGFTKRLDELRASPAWPASWVRDELNRECRVPDKAQPHAATTFMQDTLPGALTIRWAVFLPVDEHEEVVPIDPPMGGYSLILHGHFFADAGRNGLYGLDESDDVSSFPNEEARVRRDWNIALAEGSTLDLLLPALYSFCQTVGMSEERVSALTGAIKRSKTWERRKGSITASHKWLRAVTPEGFRWVLIADERTLPLLPAPREDPGRPWRVLPCLAALGEGAVLFDPSADNLVARDNDLGFWEEDEAVKLIQSIDVARTFTSSIDADYVARFLERLSSLSSESVQRELSALLRRAVDAVGLEKLRGITERVSRIAALIAPRRKLRISLRNPGVAEHLIREDGKALPWPKELDAGEASSEAEIETLEALLRALSRCASDADACRIYAQELLARVGVETRREILKRANDLAILSAFDCQTGQKVSVSTQMMAECWQRRTLFRAGQGTTDRDRAELGLLLQNVLPKATVLIVNKDLAELVLGAESAEEMPTCGSRGVLACLGHRSRDLGDVAARRELLRSLKLPDHNSVTIRGMRFLLHGAPECFDRNDRLWTDRAEGHDAWRKLWQTIIASDLRWTVIDLSLAEWVTPADQAALNLRSIEADQVVKLVAEAGAPAALDLDRAGYEAILGYPHWEQETWKSLPAHLTVQGTRVRIGETTYLVGGKLQVPAELLSGATIIAEGDRPEVRDLQSKWIPRLDHRAAIILALKTARPEAWCAQILDWLTKVDRPAWPPALDRTPWLKLLSGTALSAEKLIVLREVEAEVTDLAALSNTYATPSMLAHNLRDHPALDLLHDRAGNLAVLYSMLGHPAVPSLGEIELKSESLRQTAEMIESYPDRVARSWSLVARFCAVYGDMEGQSAFHSMTRGMPVDRLRAILLWLAERPGSDTAFVAYLASFAKTAQGPGALRGIKLRTTAGTWKPSEELCIDVPSADRGSVLCKEHRDALGQVLRSGRNQQIAQAARHTFGSSIERIRNYFAPWLRRSSGIRAQAGVVVTLLAGMTELKAEAAEMLAPHSREWVLSQIPWPNAWTGQPLDGLAPAEAIAGCTVHFTAEDVTDISCVSITGDRLRVPAEKKARNLLIGTPQCTQVLGGTVVYEVRLRNLDVNAFSNAELSKVLRATAEDLIRYMYLRGVTDLNALWGKLDRTEQLHLETAEKLILEYLPFYLGQIRPAGAPTLVRKLAEIEDLRRLRIQHEDAEGKTREYQAQRAALGRMLKDDAEVQRAVLNAVRARLRDMEYQPGSIAFELFQNADDAYLQYSEIHLAGVTRAERKNRFIILVDDGAVSFLHWGRPINYVGPAGFDGRERGYHRDLERMLTLSGSDKQDAVATGRRVTGKFGLGFKSVLLACDQPEVASGGLEFEIRAGVLPKSLSPDRAADLRGLVQKWSGPEPVPGTIIRLPAAEPSLPSAILDEFRRNAGCLCAFSSSIREISIVDSVGQQSAVWDGLKVAGNAWIETGRLPFGDESVKALRIEIEDAVVLLGLGAEGIVDLPRDTPAVWVTCPTREDQHFGFAVCGRFDVDPGRARLSRNTKNIEQAVRIGALLGERLRELRLARWEVLRKALDLGPAATEYDFWASLWRLLQRTIAQPESAVASILKPILGSAIRALARDLAVVPNGLPGAARTLTTGPKLRHKMAGAFSIDEAVEPLFNWAESKRRGYAPDSVISANNSAGLGQIGVDRVASISLASVGSWLDHQTVSPQDASVLGSVLRALPKEDDRTHEVAEDLRRAKAALEHVQFRSASKTSERARDLVAAGCGEEEARRAAFAPENRRLSPEYGELALWFFRFCRGPMAAKASDLAQWAKQAGDPVSQRAVLVYLVRGELGLEFRRQLAALGTEGSWLNELSRDELPEELRDDLLRPPVQVREPLPAHVRVADPLQALLRIERWWQCHAGRETQEYNRRVYPQGQTPRLQAPWEEDFDRSQWLILFGRAVFYRAGRATDAQHRGFIEMSQHHGFWSVYSAGDPRSRADEWMNVLERFCADQVEGGEWEQWMHFFPHFYKLSRWLEDYAELFLRLGELDRRYDLTAVLTSRTDPNQQGGGISAPPPNLGIGACFVVRELLRLGKLNSRFAHMHAFVPTGGVRELLDRLGLRVDDIPNVAISGQIYEELTNYLGPDRATFDMAFDIPFQIIAANQDLENQLLWEHHADQGGA